MTRLILFLLLVCCTVTLDAQEFYGCGGFIKSESPIDYTQIVVKLFTRQGALKYSTDCAPNNGYFLVPVYDVGDYIIKVESASGWTFTPRELLLTVDGENDACTKGEDINFQFDGLTVKGSVVSAGETLGPSGVTVTLSQGYKPIATVETDSNGGYSFSSIQPGDYLVSAIRNDLIFSTESIPATITTEDHDVKDVLVVAGYDVHGRVLSENDPVKGVQFILFAAHHLPAPTDCTTDNLPAVNSPVEALKALCYVTSAEDGTFSFHLLRNGAYAIVPHYLGENIRFDVLPPMEVFEINHAHITIAQVFRVEGFTVQGSVRSTSGGTGIPNAHVLLNGILTAMTNEEGIYQLENIKTGTYDISINAEGSGIYFATTSIKISPNTPTLPEILPHFFDICVKISVFRIPVTLENSLQKSVDISLVSTSNDNIYAAIKALTSQEESSPVCTSVPAGDYKLTPIIQDEDKKAGFFVTPSSTTISVTHRPVPDVIFSQALAILSGSIQCLGPCPSTEDPPRVIFKPLMDGESVESLPVETLSDINQAIFSVKGLLPGTYNVTVIQKSLCWKTDSKIVSLSPGKESSLYFKQSGFKLSVDASHDAELEYETEVDVKTKIRDEVEFGKLTGSFTLIKGFNQFCLSEIGTYKLKPKSLCHKFEQSFYNFETSSSSATIKMDAVTHAIKVEIHVNVKTDDIMAQVISEYDGSSSIIGPLKYGGLAPTGLYVYELLYWGSDSQHFSILPMAKSLLFKPESAHFTVKSQGNCKKPAVVVEGFQGIFLSGQITPPISGVKITIISESSPQKRLEVETDIEGRYSVGPQDGSMKYNVVAGKENFVLTPLKHDPYSFNAFKLGEIKIKLVDGSNENIILDGVLLSLSGGQGYRNNIMAEDGTLSFSRLSPGQYFLRPMKKEYNFEPASQMIDVIEGSTVDLKIIGRRVAYSVFGGVNSLNGEGEAGITVEAMGLGETEGCNISQEEAKTDAGGSFRIRGLKPGCNYAVRVKSADTCPGNGLLARTTPPEMLITMEANDVSSILFIALRKIKDMDVSGYIKTPVEHVSTLKVKLCLEDHEDSPNHTISMGQVPFFYFPSMPIDDRKYVVVLESTLSRHRYEYPEVIKQLFVANKPLRHFRFDFNPKIKAVEVDPSLHSGGLFTFPVILLLLLATYHHEILLSLTAGLGRKVTNLFNNRSSKTNVIGDETVKRKKKAFKEQ